MFFLNKILKNYFQATPQFPYNNVLLKPKDKNKAKVKKDVSIQQCSS